MWDSYVDVVVFQIKRPDNNWMGGSMIGFEVVWAKKIDRLEMGEFNNCGGSRQSLIVQSGCEVKIAFIIAQKEIM